MIRVEAITVPWAEALAQGDGVFAERFGIPVIPGWSGFPEVIGFLLRSAHKHGPARWGPHLFFDEDGALVGNGGWKGSPVDGTAELGYSVAPERQRRGIATAAVRHLLDDARGAGLRLAIAHTLAAESASTSVLRRCGFTKAGELVDPEDGLLWRWELTLG